MYADIHQKEKDKKKTKKLKKTIDHLKVLLNLKNMEVKSLKKMVKSLSIQNKKLNKNIQTVQSKIQNSKEKNPAQDIFNFPQDNPNEFLEKSCSHLNLLPKIENGNTYNLSSIENNEKYLHFDSEWLRISMKKPKNVFSKVREFFCFTIMMEKIKVGNVLAKMILEKSNSKRNVIFIK